MEDRDRDPVSGWTGHHLLQPGESLSRTTSSSSLLLQERKENSNFSDSRFLFSLMQFPLSHLLLSLSSFLFSPFCDSVVDSNAVSGHLIC
jgi:hypothetical protein